MLLRSFQQCTGRCSQHLGVKVKYFREQLFQVLRVLGVFRAYVLSNSGTSCTRRIMMYCRILYSKYFGLMYCGILPVSQYFEVQYSGYFRTRSLSGFDTVDTPGTSSISGFCTAGTARTGRVASVGTASIRSTPNMHRVLRSMKHNSTICAPVPR